MFQSERNLIESRGYNLVKIGGVERAYKSPMCFEMHSQPKLENLTKSFFQFLLTQPVVYLSKSVLVGLSVEDRDILVLELINS